MKSLRKDWVSFKLRVTESKIQLLVDLCNETQPETRLHLLRKKAGADNNHSPAAVAVRELITETRMDIALSRAKRLLTSPIEQRQVVQDANL